MMSIKKEAMPPQIWATPATYETAYIGSWNTDGDDRDAEYTKGSRQEIADAIEGLIHKNHSGSDDVWGAITKALEDFEAGETS